MKNYQKFMILACVPTLSALHSRWIAHVMGATWNGDTRILAFFMMILTMMISSAALFLRKDQW